MQIERRASETDGAQRAGAAGVHIGAIFAPLILPAIAYAVTRGRKEFIAAHARHSLVGTIVLNVLLGIAMVASFSYTVWRLWNYYQNDWQDFQWWEFLVRFIVGWIALFVLETINLFVSLRQALRAWRGEWPGGPGRK